MKIFVLYIIFSFESLTEFSKNSHETRLTWSWTFVTQLEMWFGCHLSIWNIKISIAHSSAFSVASEQLESCHSSTFYFNRVYFEKNMGSSVVLMFYMHLCTKRNICACIRYIESTLKVGNLPNLITVWQMVSMFMNVLHFTYKQTYLSISYI